MSESNAPKSTWVERPSCGFMLRSHPPILVASLILFGCDEAPTEPYSAEADCSDERDCVDDMSPDDSEAERTEEEAFPSANVEVEHGFLRTADGIMEVGARRVGDMVAFGGDMVAPASEFDANFFATAEEALAGPKLPPGTSAAAILPIGSGTWTGGIVPFAFDPSLTDRGRVYAAMTEWEAKTPFWFSEQTTCTSAPCITFKDGDGCWSEIGAKSSLQTIILENGDCGVGTAIHEIGHAIGLYHEQSRTDRDQYVIIHEDNIVDGKEDNFSRYVELGRQGTDLGPYDFQSIMHYPSTAFGKPVPGSSQRQTTISTRNGETIGKATGLSPGDVEAAFHRYNPKAIAAFADRDYKGKHQMFGPGVYLANQGGLWEVGNDAISSLVIPPGFVVTLCAHENAGPCQNYWGGTRHVGLPLDENTSRIQVAGVVTVFEDANFSGQSESFGWGDYWAKDFNSLHNDRASSLVVGPGIQVSVCVHEQTGPCETYGPDTRVNLLSAQMNDNVSRVYVQPILWGPVRFP